MKNQNKVLRARWLLYGWGLLVGSGMTLLQNGYSSETLSFNPVFPSSAYTQMLGICMELCGNLEELAAGAAADEGRQLLVDLLNGRILRLQGAVRQFIEYHATNGAMYEGDGVYILMLLREIDQAYHQCHADGNGAHGRAILEELQQQLHEIFVL